ncbi:hypothetical protein PTKIN_Ptkin01aG0356700 [Pterospermum kingtungense]
MVEAIVSGILEQLTAITIGEASEAWRLVRGVEKEVKRLERNFKAIQCELEDAEEKRYLNKRVKHWLEIFEKVSYDMEDILDDWRDALRIWELQKADHGVESSTNSASKWKVCACVSCFSFGSQIARRHDIATRIKEINEELDQIAKDKDKLELIRREIKQPKREESTSFVDVSQLLGRDLVKEDIIRTLLCDEEEEESRIPTIAIVGMGGIGKTALAQLIYNDPRIQKHFDQTIWVCVSDPFDQFQIARAILEKLDPPESFQDIATLQTLLSKIHEKLKEKKLFLVLDDVWTERGQEWEKLKAAAFHNGMRILVTTRKESVASHMECFPVFSLDLLSEDICWLILARKAFTGRNKDVRGESLEDIGREIAKKCSGLPLAAQTLGGLLKDKSQREEWQNVLNSKIWKLDVAREFIFTPLLLSYYDLPSSIRRCLLHCVVFPKNYEIDKDELVQQWMAQGYLNSDDELGIELKGEHYFNCLATRSFFQDFREDDEGALLCKMHDMVHDFVRFLSEDGFVTEEVIKDLTLDLSSKKPRHLRLLIESRSSSPMSIYGTEQLRSLVAVSNVSNETASEVVHKLFGQSKRLRLLEFDLFYKPYAKGIANDIGNLIHLRYLSFKSCYGLKSLPEAVCELPNLQSLNLRDCIHLQKLPVGIGKLINLKYLCTKGCDNLTYYPKGIGNLTSLMRLGTITIADGNDSDRFSWGDIENLDLLGNLCVQLTENAIDWGEAKKAKLHKKTHLKRMTIFTSCLSLKEEKIIQALNLPSDFPLMINKEIMIKKKIKEKIRCALIVQKKALHFI